MKYIIVEILAHSQVFLVILREVCKVCPQSLFSPMKRKAIYGTIKAMYGIKKAKYGIKKAMYGISNASGK
jgi:hypothetical protein